MVLDGAESMEMQQILHRYLARLSDTKRVLMVGNDFELLQSLAISPLSELVIFDREADPNAPKAETPLGAPLRFRPDWQERPRSKDLIIDLPGTMPKSELERLLKKAGLYITTKKRRLSDFECIPITSRRLPTALLGTTDSPPVLDWQLSELPPVQRPTAYVFSRESVALPAILSATESEMPRSNDDLAIIDALEDKSSKQAKEVAVLTERLQEAERTIRENAALQKQLETALRTAEKDQEKLKASHRKLEQEKLELEQENDTISARAATLQADENRFSRLETRFKKYQEESQRELETLQSELRTIAAPAHDLEALALERDDAKERLAYLVSAINELFSNGLAQKKTPKLPPLDVSKNDAPLKLWLARMEALLIDQQARIDEQGSEVKSLKTQLRGAERKVNRLENKAAPANKKGKTVQISLTTTGSTATETKLKQLLKLEQELRTDSESRLALLIKRTEVMSRLYREQQTSLDELSESMYEEKSLRMAAEADQVLLRHELMVKHDELEERGRILDTYASLQGLLSDSLNQAEEARLEAEDARRLADENLRILRDEFERSQHDGNQKRDQS